MAYARNFSLNRMPQTEALPGQARNNAGGFSFVLDDWARLDRFLILGSDSGSFYLSARKLTRDNAGVFLRCLAADPARAVGAIVAIDVSGRAPKKGAILFALALALASDNDVARKAAYGAVSQVARTGADILNLVSMVDGWRGWSRGLRRAIGGWYVDRKVENLAYQVVKYRDRGLKAAEGSGTSGFWTHRDVLRMAHPAFDEKAEDATSRRAVLDWIVGRAFEGAPKSIVGFEAAKVAKTAKSVAKIVREHDLPREAIDTAWLNDRDVWLALLARMPLGASVRNLGKMTAVGALKPLSKEVDAIVERLSDAEAIRSARMHPLAFLLALKAYASGGRERAFHRADGREATTWDPIPAVVDALDKAFYIAFAGVNPSNKRMLYGIDVSGSMASSFVSNTSLTCREASAALALVALSTEPKVHVFGFSNRFVPLKLSARMRLDAAVKEVSGLPFQSTDCSLPMLYAIEHGLEVDAFVVVTDNETIAGKEHPVEALRRYRRKTGIAAKLVVVGMTATEFTIADPSDGGSMDVVGFDASAPALISDFLRD